jgi:hypothetical protein
MWRDCKIGAERRLSHERRAKTPEGHAEIGEETVTQRLGRRQGKADVQGKLDRMLYFENECPSLEGDYESSVMCAKSCIATTVCTLPGAGSATKTFAAKWGLSEAAGMWRDCKIGAERRAEDAAAGMWHDCKIGAERRRSHVVPRRRRVTQRLGRRQQKLASCRDVG